MFWINAKVKLNINSQCFLHTYFTLSLPKFEAREARLPRYEAK